MILRPYQRNAIDAVYSHLRDKDTNPVVCIPTGGGKTPVMATICRDAATLWDGRILVLAHVKELLQQSVDKIKQVDSGLDVGIVSAGLSRKEYDKQIVVAGIQSSHQYPEKFGHRDLVLVDEAHTIPTDGYGMYQRLLGSLEKINPDIRIVGFTATPFRLDSGLICREDHFLNELCYEVSVKELIDNGYLCKLSNKSAKAEVDLTGVHIRAGDYVAEDMEAAYMEGDYTARAVDEMLLRSVGCKSTLIFCSGVKHAENVKFILNDVYGCQSEIITGETPAAERQSTIDRFRGGQLAHLVNVNVLTIGFDAPNVDCVVLFRSTLSPGLYYQMVGRGFRIAEGKEQCLVLDFGRNIKRHGCVDKLRINLPGHATGASPTKVCPECQEAVAIADKVCSDCGYEWPVKEEPQVPKTPKHDVKPGSESVVSGEVEEVAYDVLDIRYYVHTKRGAGPETPKTMRVDYQVGLAEKYSEWICFEHTGFAKEKAIKWWKTRSNDPIPDSAYHAVTVAEAGGLAHTRAIKVRFVSGEQFPRIVDYDLGEKPEFVPMDTSEEEVPF